MAHVDWDAPSSETLKVRLRDHWGVRDAQDRVLEADIQDMEKLLHGSSRSRLSRSVGLEELVAASGGVDVIIGGPPCQAYSMAGRIRDENGMHSDYRNFLFENYLQVVQQFEPPIVLFENVPGMLSAQPGGVRITERIRVGFADAGYEILSDLRRAVIDASEYGVPQIRKRVIMIGVAKKYFRNPQGTLENYYTNILPGLRTPYRATVRTAIGNLPALIPLAKPTSRASHAPASVAIPDHIPRFHNDRDVKIFRDLARDIESGAEKYSSIDAIKKLYTERTTRKSNVHKYHVLRWDEPSNLIPAHLFKDGLRHIHPDSRQARSITVREAARLQTFDDSFPFSGSMGDRYKMIGNAVPPLFARALAVGLFWLWGQRLR